MTEDFSKIDQLISDFESGSSVDSLLAEINSDESLMFQWGQDHFDDFDFNFVVHEREIFITDGSLEEFYDLDELRKIRNNHVVEFIYDQVKDCVDSEVPAIHFFDNDRSVISAMSDIRGQGGYWFVDFDITENRSVRYQKLLDEGYLFLPNEHFVIDEELLIEKYQKLIRDRLKGDL
jgi:hypothetical protein